MRIVIAPDKFKGSLGAAEVAEAIAAGVRDKYPDAQLDLCPMADGGEGTVAALVKATSGHTITRQVTGPLAEMKVDAVFGILGDNQTAVIEMSAASGLSLLKDADRNPLNTTTVGTGELLCAAAEAGATHIILGIGGSATCDGGIGCAQGAGLTVLLRDGSAVSPTEPLTARDLDQVLMVKYARGSPVDRVKITVACDVTNPLFGPDGAAVVYAPQKGASASEVAQLDQMLQRLAERTGKLNEANTPGAGAAGGLGFGMLAFFAATLRPGIEIVIDAVNLADRLRGADLCITGEGKLDHSTLSGKTAAGVARLCREIGVPCAAIGGSVEANAGLEQLFNRMVQLRQPGMSLQESMSQTRQLLRQTAASAGLYEEAT
ncbi:MAG TPA: glycerate kinase [Tepidisphaeraceae bacterium]|nr:glycerate kinase [Tepidisphaeraceae bacterium]